MMRTEILLEPVSRPGELRTAHVLFADGLRGGSCLRKLIGGFGGDVPGSGLAGLHTPQDSPPSVLSSSVGKVLDRSFLLLSRILFFKLRNSLNQRPTKYFLCFLDRLCRASLWGVYRPPHEQIYFVFCWVQIFVLLSLRYFSLYCFRVNPVDAASWLSSGFNRLIQCCSRSSSSLSDVHGKSSSNLMFQFSIPIDLM